MAEYNEHEFEEHDPEAHGQVLRLLTGTEQVYPSCLCGSVWLGDRCGEPRRRKRKEARA